MNVKKLSLDSFVHIKKLQIGPPQITKNKLNSEYKVELQDGTINSNTFTYSYEEDVFELIKPESVNLASMMSVQVALNYGLFCEEIIFDGLFDDSDRRFILDMIENTSREIYVNKLLSANPFLVKEYQNLQIEKRKRYTQAKITFINSGYRDLNFEWQYHESDINNYVILSSGGKDSLLSYGLFKELKNVHPVFINESGRHWFTALNAFRYLKEKEKNTARVWCNSDRIFN